MAKYAFRDKERKNIIYAYQAIEEDRNKVFYCPNHACNAKLYICSIDGSKNAYFRATKLESQHIGRCPYKSSIVDFDSNKYDESKFNYDNAIENLISPTKISSKVCSNKHHENGESRINILKTLGQIYSMCKSLNVKNYYSNKEISEMILDSRSAYRYPKGVFGNKIIEATVCGTSYNRTKKEIYLVAPIVDQITSAQHKFILSFSSEELYKKIQNEIYNNSDKIIVVAGKWSKYKSYNKTKIIGKKQILIVKN